jgi:hypothetical protein
MARFKMSEPRLAVQAVDELTSAGYGAGIDAPAEDDTSSYLTAWTTEESPGAEGIPALVRRVDRGAVEQHDPPPDAVDVDSVPDELVDNESAGTLESGGEGRHVVRPRRVWAGVALAVVGLVVLAVGLMVQSWWVGGVGVVLLLVGAVLGWSGGGAYDVHATMSAHHEVEDLRTGDTHEGIEPGQMVRDPQVEKKSVAVERRRRRLIERGQQRHQP